MKRKNIKRIGFWSALSVLVGSVIGIGIFFKNGSIFLANNYDGYGILISWILSSIIAISTALSFGEISSSSSSEAGLAEWSNKFVGKKFGRFVKFNFPVFYFGILAVAIFIFTAESALNIFTSINPNILNGNNIYYVFLIAALLFLFFIFTNIKFRNVSTRLQIVLTSIKFIPLVATIIIGFIFFQSSNINLNNFFIPKPNTSTSINFSGILTSLPAILFAFDSFLVVGSLSSEMKDGKRKIPLVIIIGMVICSIIYLLITVVQILIGEGIISNLYTTIFSFNPQLSLGILVSLNFFVFISALGVCNGLVIAGLRNFDYLIKNKIIFGYHFLSRVNNKTSFLGAAILYSIVGFIWFILMLVPSFILQNDRIVDGISNFPTLFFFLIYGTIIFYGILNRFKNFYKIRLINKKIMIEKSKRKIIKVNKIPGFLFFSIISIIGILLAVGYQLIYANLILLFQSPNDLLSWGVLVNNPTPQLPIWAGSIVFFTSIILFFTLPHINKFLFFLQKKINHYKIIRIYKKGNIF